MWGDHHLSWRRDEELDRNARLGIASWEDIRYRGYGLKNHLTLEHVYDLSRTMAKIPQYLEKVKHSRVKLTPIEMEILKTYLYHDIICCELDTLSGLAVDPLESFENYAVLSNQKEMDRIRNEILEGQRILNSCLERRIPARELPEDISPKINYIFDYFSEISQRKHLLFNGSVESSLRPLPPYESPLKFVPIRIEFDDI